MLDPWTDSAGVVFLERLRCFSSQIAFEYSVRNRTRAPGAPYTYLDLHPAVARRNVGICCGLLRAQGCDNNRRAPGARAGRGVDDRVHLPPDIARVRSRYVNRVYTHTTAITQP